MNISRFIIAYYVIILYNVKVRQKNLYANNLYMTIHQKSQKVQRSYSINKSATKLFKERMCSLKKAVIKNFIRFRGKR